METLLALVMYIEKISPEEIVKIEIATGEPIFYKFHNKEFIRT
jgi:bisphosphoglycerate-dependent phosphoglycerate mutase